MARVARVQFSSLPLTFEIHRTSKTLFPSACIFLLDLLLPRPCTLAMHHLPSQCAKTTVLGSIVLLSLFSGDDPPGSSPDALHVDVTPRAAQQNCMTAKCHQEYAKLRFSHGPVVLRRCLFCHEPDEDSSPYQSGDDHTFELVARDGRLCNKCHESQTTEKHVHYPLRRLRCIGCHDPHGSNHPAMMRKKNLADNCYECHEQTMTDEPSVHTPVALGQCTTCHDPHASPHPAQLHASGTELCLSCHAEKTKELESHRHAHRPVIEDCSKCHDPHDGPDSFRLKKTVPDLCFECHQELAEQVHGSQIKHAALDQKRSCLYCHDPHTADFSVLVRAIPKELCITCHDQPIVATTGILRDMKSYLEDNLHHHGPIREGDCGACHDPHGSNNMRLLRKAYPKEFYSPFDLQKYELCFSCHERSLVIEEETDTLTGFRNGTKNLHFVHVNRERKGRTCRACHDVHASRFPKHIANSVPFGPNWSYTIKFSISENGGGCGPGCHTARKYDRETPVRNK